MSYRIGICEDEPGFRKELIKMLNNIAKSNQLQIKIETFDNLNRLENFVDDPLEEPLDLILLDIYFDGDEYNGMEYAKKLRESKNGVDIIFITNSQEFALEGYTIDSKAYILKPVDEQKLEEAVLRAYNNGNSQIITIETPSKTLALDLNRVLYFEIINKELTVNYTDSMTETIRISLKDIKDLLPEDQFFQIHRSYIVSIPGIYAIQDHEAILLNKNRIPISRKYFNTLQKKLVNWHLNG